jgi:hypothetical protein
MTTSKKVLEKEETTTDRLKVIMKDGRIYNNVVKYHDCWFWVDDTDLLSKK